MKAKLTNILQKSLDALKMANTDSIREEGWSTVPEINSYRMYVGLEEIPKTNLDRLVTSDAAIRKTINRTPLYRTHGGGMEEPGSTSGKGGGPYEPPYQPPEPDYPPGQNGDQGDSQYPPKYPPKGEPQEPTETEYLRGLAGGAPTAGGVPMPMPMGGIAKQLL